MPPLLAFENVTKILRGPGGEKVRILDRVSFEIERGDSIGVFGLRRSGKSTLLRIAAGLVEPDAGAVRFDGHDITAQSEAAHARLLRTEIGLASADLHGARSQRVVDFVSLPLLSRSASLHDANVVARQALERTGVANRADARLGQLSAGERTRVSLARALVREPALLLVDEPSLAPSPRERDEVHALLRSFAGDPALTLIVASEDLAAIRTARRLMTISDGELRSSSQRSGQVVAFPEHAQRSP